MRIFGLTGGVVGHGGFRYRLTVPFAEAAHQGLAAWTYGPEITTSYAPALDVLVGQGLSHPEVVPLWEAFQAMDDGPIVVLDHDDDFFNPRPDILDHGFGGYERYKQRNMPAVASLLATSDLVTVSVPHLAEQYRQYTDAPIVVLPNTVDPVLIEVPQRHREPGERVRVGWSGSPSHELDWRIEAPGIAYGLRKADAHLVLMGYDPRHLIKYPDTEHHPWRKNLDEYYLMLTTFHIAICPLADDLFNRSKSPLKALEASALAIPVVASAVRPYEDFVIHGETGFLCRRDHEWAKALRTLANDEDLRLEMGQAARRHAANFTTTKRAGDWIETYQQAYERKHGHRAPPLSQSLPGIGAGERPDDGAAGAAATPAAA
jgi:glycosyltransferase involved in cell wall biosynthesis